jgi:DNA-binding winged helix-turn-helix (wHTH) protein/Tfp pilus assembly protein PilF
VCHNAAALSLRRFGVFEFDEETGELTRSGRSRPLPPQAARILVMLLSRPGGLVTRDELRRELWGDRTFVDFDKGLNFAVSRLRLALGYDARSPRFLETLPRRGYRFLGSVETVAPRAVPAAARTGAPSAWGARALLAALLAPLLVAAAPGRAHTRASADPAALAAFQGGLRESARGSQGRRRSVGLFRQAAARDPRFAEAQYALAETLISLAESGELSAEHALPAARRAAERALALEPVSSTALLLADVRLVYDWDWDGSRRLYERALELDPDSNLILARSARLYSAAGRHERALELVRRAESLNPACELVVRDVGLVAFQAGRFPEAIRKLRAALALGPPGDGDAGGWQRANLQSIFRAHLQLGATREAAEDARALLRALALPPDRLAAFDSLGPEQAVERFLRGSIRAALSRADRQPLQAEQIALLHAALGERDEALAWLERAARERSPGLVYALGDPELAVLTGLPRWEALRRRVGSLPLPAGRPATAAIARIAQLPPRGR